MSETLPAPLVPPDVDLRGYGFMPLYGDRLFKSESWKKASFEARCAMVRLWWHAFAHERPAASLPDDDMLLADYAGYGDAVKPWLRVREQALKHWQKCSDGRFYDPVLAEIAMDAWALRVTASKKGRDGASKRWGKHRHETPIAQALPNNGSSNATATKNDSNREDRKGQGKETTTPDPLPDWVPRDAWDGYVGMRKARRKPLTKHAVHLAVRELEKLRMEGNDPRAVLEQSTLNSWQGLFPLRRSNVEKPPDKQDLHAGVGSNGKF